MSTPEARNNFIPLQKDDLADALAEEADLTPPERQGFRTLCRLLNMVLHVEYYQRHEKLKAAYYPFDPDADTRLLFKLPAAEQQRRQNTLFNDVAHLLEGAGFRHLNRDEIVATLARSSAWGLRMDVDFHLFERLAILVRGETSERRSLRRLRKALRSEELEVPIYQRVVMLMKMRPHKRLANHVDTEHVYLQLFKQIPQLDINMLLPGARARIQWLDRGRIIVPFLAGIGLAAWQITEDVIEHFNKVLHEFLIFKPAVVWAVASAALGYAVKSYYTYQQTRQSYNLALTQILYYQNLDTNQGVLHRMLDEAEEQDCREAMLAYFFLWRRGGDGGWTPAQLQEQVEADLERRAELKFCFDTRDCLPRLERHRLVEKQGDRYRAVCLAAALEALESAWQGYLPPRAGDVSPPVLNTSA